LDEEIPKMLKHWNKMKSNALECFTKETLDAIILTSRSTANFIKYLLNGGLQFVLTRRFSTDNIERFHGAVRNYCGNNDSPAVGHALSAIERISRTQLAMTSMQCNTPLISEAILKKSEQLITERNTKCTRVRARDVLRMTEKPNENLSKSLTCSPGLMFIPFHYVILYKEISFQIDHVPFIPDALSCDYITGYTIFKYGQLEDYCIALIATPN
jgi:hypothetical protein